MNTKRGQALFEYAVIIGVVVLALGMMQVYVRRGNQAGIKIAADELGRQEDSVELDSTKGTVQSSQVRSLSAATYQRQLNYGGSSTINVNEQNEIVAPSQSEYWSNWEED